MDKKCSWKRTEDIEIDITDLLCSICGQWKRIVICALVSALILGGYKWLREKERIDIEARADTAEKAILTESEEQAVADAVRLKNETEELETYLDKSILMQLDPYHKNRSVMLYCIDQAKRQELPGIAESYLNFVLNGGAADALQEYGSIWNTDKSYLAEVMYVYQKTYSSPYQVSVSSQEDSSQTAESLFYVEVIGRDAVETEKMALDMQDVLEGYSSEVKETAGKHRLKLVSSEQGVIIDSGLQAQQHDKRALLSENKANLKAVTDAFIQEQMAVYKEAVYEKEESGKTEKEESAEDASGGNIPEESISGGSPGAVMKYTFAGLVAGIFIYACFYACWYVFNDTVKSIAGMKRLYTFPVFGGIQLEGGGGKKGRGVPGLGQETGGYTEAQVMNRIRLACKKNETGRLYAASDFPLETMEKECLERMAGQLRDCGIEMKIAENAGVDTAVWDGMAETGNVLMVCRMGTTTHRMIDSAVGFYLENGIAVAGAAVFL